MAVDRSTDDDVDVLILGASFAGIEVLYQLARRSDRIPLRVAVVDRQTEHGYLPLVQERLCQTTSDDASRLATRRYVESLPWARFVHDEIVAFDPKEHRVELRGGQLSARFVVVALGSVVTAPAAIEGADRVFDYKDAAAFDRAQGALATAMAERAPIAVIGGGVSGVELAGELAASRNRGGRGEVAVSLVAADRELLAGFAPNVRRVVTAALRAQGVEVRTGARCVAVHDQGITVDEGGSPVEIPASVTLWAGGIAPSPCVSQLDLPLDSAGWLRVGPTLQCFPTTRPSDPEVFACGDAVRVVGGTGPWPTMQRAIECLWQAKVVADNVMTLARSEPGYPDGVPPLQTHTLRKTFFFGISAGVRSYVVWRRFVLDIPGLNHRFRRWLMRRYFARYTPLTSGLAETANVDSEPTDAENA